MSAKNKIKKNFIYNLAYQILVVLLPLITTPYVSRVLGSEGVGIFGFTNSVNSYFVLFAVLGTALYGTREIAYRQDNKHARSETFWHINIVRWIATSVSLLIYYFICMRTGEYSFYYAIFAIQIIANAFDVSWYFQGLEMFKTITIRNTIVKLTFIALTFMFIKTPEDLGLYIALFCGSSLISNLSLWVLIPKTIEKVKITKAGLKKHVWPIFVMFLPQAMTEVYAVLDKTMLGILVKDMNEVGIYEQSQKLEKFSLSVVTALSPVMASRIANLHSKNDKGEIKTKLKKSLHFVWLISAPVAFGIAGITANLIPWFLGEQFLNAIPVMQIGTLLIFAIALSNAIGHQYLIPTGSQRFFTLSIFAGAVTNLTLNFILIPNYRAIGAIIASVLAEFAVTGVQLYALKKSVMPIREVFRPALKCLICGVLMFIVVVMVGKILPETAIGTFVQIAVGGLVYVGLMTLLRDAMMMEIWTTVESFTKKLFRK